MASISAKTHPFINLKTISLLVTCWYEWNRKHVPIRKFSYFIPGTIQSITLWN